MIHSLSRNLFSSVCHLNFHIDLFTLNLKRSILLFSRQLNVEAQKDECHRERKEAAETKKPDPAECIYTQ